MSEVAAGGDLVPVADPITGEVVSYPAHEAVVALLEHSRALAASADSSVQLMQAESLAKLAQNLAKVIGASVATQNECLRTQWHVRLLLLERYEQAQEAGEVKRRGNPDFSIVSHGNNSDKPDTADLGLSRKKLSETRKVARAGGMSFADAIISEASRQSVEGTSTLLVRAASGAINAKEQQAIRESDAELPEGQYEVIVIDPPWPMQKIDRDVRAHQAGFDYPTMDEDELKAFPLPDMAAEDCHLFLWTTHKFLPMALRLAEHWGFRYVCNFVWHKPGGFQPIGLPQYNCEFALYCRKGAPKFVDTKQFFTCFEAGRREHSRKPDEFYETVARVTAGRRIEVFAREPREGFDVFGNETNRFEGAA